MQLIVFRVPSNEGFQFQETFAQGSMHPLAFLDVTVSIERLLGN